MENDVERRRGVLALSDLRAEFPLVIVESQSSFSRTFQAPLYIYGSRRFCSRVFTMKTAVFRLITSNFSES